MIVLLGESACGKSTVEKILVKNYGYKKIVSYTTRPIRAGEKNNVDYTFVSNEAFEELKRRSFFAETAEYNGWKYGTPVSECKGNTVAVVTPSGLRSLRRCKDLDVTSFYIKVSRRERMIKALRRGDNVEEIYRRSVSDIGMYDGIENEVDYIILNDYYVRKPRKVAQQIHNLTKKHRKENTKNE